MDLLELSRIVLLLGLGIKPGENNPIQRRTPVERQMNPKRLKTGLNICQRSSDMNNVPG